MSAVSENCAAFVQRKSTRSESAGFSWRHDGNPPRRPKVASLSRWTALAILAMTASGSAAFADILNFQADLNGAREVPPNGSPATGHVDATLDTDTHTLTWTCTYSGLSSGPIGAHFHGPVSYIGATSEENAPIQVGTPGNLASPFSGRSAIDATQAEDLKIGRWYFNLHSTKFPAGEIRGPVVRK
jgi:hypothetical protein